MDWKKQTISFMLAGCMTASALPAAFAVEAQAETPVPVSEAVTAQPQTSVQGAESGKCGANLTWTLDDEGALTISGTGKMDNYRDTDMPWVDFRQKIKSVVIQPGVTGIGNAAFAGCENVTSITIPDSVTDIGQNAFYWCKGLTSITIPDSVTRIGENAFYWCTGLTSITLSNSLTSISESAFAWCWSLKSITIPGSVTTIEDTAFRWCYELTSVTIPNSVTRIGAFAFADCQVLENITIPDSVTSIGEDVFSQSERLKSITVDTQNQSYSSENGVLLDKMKTKLICFPEGKSGEYRMPDSVTAIEDETFSECKKLTDIIVGEQNRAYSSEDGVLFDKTKTKLLCFPAGRSGQYVVPDGVTRIGAFAFAWRSGLTGVTLPDTLTTIGENAFFGCKALTSLTIPDSVKSIGPGAFHSCTGIKTFYFDGDAPEIPDDELTTIFAEVTATAYYPQGNRTWTENARERFGGDITWKTWIPGGAKKPVTQVFSDVPANAWYVNAVQYAYDNNIMAGTGGKFMPNGTMTRAMVVQTLYNISGKPAVSGKPGFSDIKTTDWYGKAVLWAEQNKVAAGSDGKFNPNGLVTREQFAQFLYNYAGSPKVSGELRGFADTASVSGWAKNALTWANQKGIVSGKPSGGKLYLDPKGRATRAEAAAMLMKYQTM